MKVNLEYPKFAVIDDLGNPLSGGKIYFYEAGTSTLKDTYSDPEGTIKNANPVILDSRGEADIFLDRDPYKIVVKTADDVTIITRDNYQSYMQADDTTLQNLLINADARENVFGGTSGSTFSVGDVVFDNWVCSAAGAVTFTAEDNITLAAGCKLTHNNDDLLEVSGATATIFVASGQVTVNGLGIGTAVTIYPGNSYTFTIDATSPLEVGSTNSETYSGLALVLGSNVTNTIRPQKELLRFLTKNYLKGKGVISRTEIKYVDSSNITIQGGAYRLTGADYDKIVYIQTATPITVTIDYDSGGSSLPPWGIAAWLYIKDTTKTLLTDASDFRLCPEWEPTYNVEKNGWYYNNNRCIGVIWLSPTNNNIMEFDTGADGCIAVAPKTSSEAFASVALTSTALTASTDVPAGIGNIELVCHAWADSTAGYNTYLYYDDNATYDSSGGGCILRVQNVGSYPMVNSCTYNVACRDRRTLYHRISGDGTPSANLSIRRYWVDAAI